MNNDLETKFELTKGLETVSYEEGIAYFQKLANTFPEIKMKEMGMTDCGLPLHLVLYSADQDFDIENNKNQGKAVILINNAIHPGEPDGVDASMMLLRNIAQNAILETEMKDVLLAVIPFYNIGGALNRNTHSRANQNGPKEYGFRGNSRNYDLNRDFIKNDTRNARAFAKIFHYLDPDMFLDTHVSNGADYQYVITLISTQKDKFGGSIADFQENTILPFLYDGMEKAGFDMTPYVNTWGQHLKNPTPDDGIEQFADYPRYSTGYSTLFNTIGFMTETHMLKPYDQRVASTYAFMETLIRCTHTHRDELLKVRAEKKSSVKNQNRFDIAWQLDTSKHSTINFKGYASSYIPSKVTGKPRLFYDHTKPYVKEIPYYDTYKASISVQKPSYYIIPQSWHTVIDLLKLNGVNMEQLTEDETLEVEYYTITDYKTISNAYEGHYMHYDTKIESGRDKVTFRKGDYRIPVNQEQNRYIVETLEPQAVDSYFTWNFFDMILQRKEHYSSYVFEDLAEQLLEDDPDLKNKFEQKKNEDPAFAADANKQLNFIYRQSPHSEKSYKRYPVYRVMQ